VKSLPFRLSEIAILLTAIAAPAFGGRMIDPGARAVLPGVREQGAIQPADNEMVRDEDDEPAEESDMISEPADDADVEIDGAPASAAPPARWKWHSSFNLSAVYDDNIFISSRHKQADEYFRLGADFSLTWGDYLQKQENYLTIQYAPSVILFADHTEQNGFEQEGTLAGQWRLSKLALGAQFGVQSLSGGDVDVGDRADRTLYQIALTSKYDCSEKTSLEASFYQNTADYRAHLGSVDWMNQNWIDYQVFPKTRIGVGLTLGLLEPEGSDAQTYEQALVRLTLPASGKLSLTANGGVEFRQLGSSAGNQTEPVFRAGASYRPFDGTEISLEASRRIYSSAAQAGQNYTATGVTASVRQRLFQRFFVTFAGGYEDAKYEGVDAQASTSRHDQYVFARPGISFAFTKRTTCELYFQYRHNASTAPLFSFDNNVAGLQATLSF